MWAVSRGPSLAHRERGYQGDSPILASHQAQPPSWLPHDLVETQPLLTARPQAAGLQGN